MIYKNNFITTLSKQEILTKLKVISSRKKAKYIDDETFLVSIRGLRSIYNGGGFNFLVKIIIQNIVENKNLVIITVYPNFTFYLFSLFWVFIFVVGIFSSDISYLQINREFFLDIFIVLSVFSFVGYLIVWEFLDQRKRIIRRIVDITNTED